MSISHLSFNKSVLIISISILCLSWIISRNIPEEKIVLPVSEYRQNENGADSVETTWKEMELEADNLTHYELIQLNDSTEVIKATSNNAASGLIYITQIDTKKYPVIEWSWKIEEVLSKGNYKKKGGDDYAARIYITFEYDKSRLSFSERVKLWFIQTFTSYEIPLRSINYIWANKAPAGTIAPNPFTDWVQMVAVESGNSRAGNWITERRNIFKDYKAAFGEEPGKITGVAIMTDSDNTGESATGYYGDISFEAEKP